MRSLALAFLLVCVPAISQVTVPTQPIVASIIPDNDVVHVFTGQVDADYDGMFDDGDKAAQWLIVNASSFDVQRTLTLPWSSTSVNRPAFDPILGLMVFGIGDTVISYTSRTQERSATPIWIGPNSASAYHPATQRLFISSRPNYTDPGTVVVFDLPSLAAREISVGVNPQQTVFFQKADRTTAITLCEGLMGTGTGSLVFIDQIGVTQSITIGDTPNHMAIDEAAGVLYVAMSGEHAIKVVDVTTRTVTATWPTPTSGFNGPREVAINDDFVFVTTYASTVHTFRRSDGTLVGTIQLPAKADPIAAIGDKLWVGLSYVTGGYTGTGNVLVYPQTATSVSEDRSVATHIHCDGTTLHVPFSATAGSFVILGSDGRTYSAECVDATLGTLNVSTLATGMYVVTNGRNAAVFTILR